MFIHSKDKELNKKLIKEGFRVLKESEEMTTFVYNPKLKFDFTKVNKEKVIFTNKLTF